MASRELISFDDSLALKVLKWVSPVFLAFYLVWALLPLFIMFVSSFKNLLDAFAIPAPGNWLDAGVFFDFKPTVAHYVKLFTENNFGTYLFNSLVTSIGSAVIAVTLGAMCAYSLARTNFRGKKDFLFWIISTRMAPIVAVIVPLYAIFRSVDLVGTLPGLILAFTTFNLPFAIWLLKGFFDSVPYAIEEAAQVDGCNRFQAFLTILPLVAPGIGAFVILGILFAWNDFLFAMIIGSGSAKTLPAATKELIQPQNIDWGTIMAAGVVTTAPMIPLGLLVRRYLIAGLTMGAVKE